MQYIDKVGILYEWTPPCFDKVLSAECLSRPIVTRDHAPRRTSKMPVVSFRFATLQRLTPMMMALPPVPVLYSLEPLGAMSCSHLI